MQTKREVDAHVKDIFSKAGSDSQRIQKCLPVSRLYAQIKEFETAKGYIETYLSKENKGRGGGEGYKLLGDIHWELNEDERALEAYKKAYNLSPSKEALNRICDLFVRGAGEEGQDKREDWFNLQKKDDVVLVEMESNGYVNANGSPGVGSKFLMGLASQKFLSPGGSGGGMQTMSPSGFNGTPNRLNFQPSLKNYSTPQVIKTPKQRGIGMGTACVQASPERIVMQMAALEKKCDGALSSIAEQNAQILSAVNGMKDNFRSDIRQLQDELKDLKLKVESLNTANDLVTAKEMQKDIHGLTSKVDSTVGEIKSLKKEYVDFKKKFEEMVAVVSASGSGSTPTRPSLEGKTKIETGQKTGTDLVDTKPRSELFKKSEPDAQQNVLKEKKPEPAATAAAFSNFAIGFSNPTGEGQTPKPFENFTFSAGFGELASATTTFAKPTDFKGFGGEGQQVFSNFGVANPVQKGGTERKKTTSEGEDAEEFVPTAEFAPVIPLPPLVETKLGDENEHVIFEHRAKIYRYDSTTKEWKERGVGNIKILQDKDNLKAVRVVMWREKIGKLACNHRITSDMTIKNYKDNPKILTWTAMDHAEEEGKPELFTCRFGQEDKCAEFKAKFEEMVALISTSGTTPTRSNLEDRTQQETEQETATSLVDTRPISELFKKPEGSWDCPACYINNKAAIVNCIACETLKPGAVRVEDEKKPELATNAFSNFTFGFSNLTGESQTPKPFENFTFSTGFGELASTTTTFAKPADFRGFGGGGQQVFSNFGVANPVQKGGTERKKTTSEGEDAEEFVPTAEFAPVIPLPPLVETKLGDENEHVIFEHRAKIYRYDSTTKEWKERGVGNIKILQDKDNLKAVRVVMWREKIGKLACNHRITSDLTIENYRDNPKILFWKAVDHSENEGRPELFTCRFGQEDKCAEFKAKFEEMVALISTSGTTPTRSNLEDRTQQETEQETATSLVDTRPISELFKKPEGSWDCPACYINNKAGIVNCIACETLKPGAVRVEDEKKPELATNAFSNFTFGFSNLTGESQTPKPFENFTFSAGFGELASATTTFAKPTDFKGFGGEGQQVFSNFGVANPVQKGGTERQKTTSESEDAEEFVPTAEFAPVIPLPPLVETKLGDENEHVIFEHRAKIYRYDSTTKEWKERGVGNIKILQDKDNLKAVRVVMWREKIGKLACNHRITSDLTIENYRDNPKILFWKAVDHSENEGRPELFTCRFGQEEKCAEFKSKFEEMVTIIGGSAAAPSAPVMSPSPSTSQPEGQGASPPEAWRDFDRKKFSVKTK